MPCEVYSSRRPSQYQRDQIRHRDILDPENYPLDPSMIEMELSMRTSYEHMEINGLTPWCRRPPFQGGAAGKGQNGPHVQ